MRIKFLRKSRPYNAGETATLPDDQAASLVAKGAAVRVTAAGEEIRPAPKPKPAAAPKEAAADPDGAPSDADAAGGDDDDEADGGGAPGKGKAQATPETGEMKGDGKPPAKKRAYQTK